MMGRGLVHPLDHLASSDDPPSHPELLDELATWFSESDCDLRGLLREIAATAAYQRSSRPSDSMSTENEAPDRFALAAVRPLTPEQLGFSVMQATGLRRGQEQAARQQLETNDPRLFQLLEADDQRRRRRGELVEEALFAKLTGPLGGFVRRFGKLPGTPQDLGFEATVHQALFMTNGSAVIGWLAPSGENLTARLANLDDRQAVQEIYLSVLSRLPAEDEAAEAEAFLAELPEARDEALREYVWSLLCCVEFRFNH